MEVGGGRHKYRSSLQAGIQFKKKIKKGAEVDS